MMNEKIVDLFKQELREEMRSYGVKPTDEAVEFTTEVFVEYFENNKDNGPPVKQLERELASDRNVNAGFIIGIASSKKEAPPELTETVNEALAQKYRD